MHEGLRITRVLLLAILVASQSGGLAAAAEPTREFRFHRDFVLGTSMDLAVLATDESSARTVERLVIAEVERLAAILSTYEPDSELNRLNRSPTPMACSPELIDVLAACEAWRIRSGGAFNVQAAQIANLWKQAEKSGQPPTQTSLLALAQQIDGRAWELGPGKATARKLGTGNVSVDALAKGFIVDHAIAVARTKETRVSGILLDIGGDVAVWRSESQAADHFWQVGVADPRHPQDNAPPLATVRMSAGAIATSGHYARFFRVGDQRYSHILDPRTGQPADHIASATVVATDCGTADALATILCVLSPRQSLDLLRTLRQQGTRAECLIVDREGQQWTSPAWRDLLDTEVRPILAMDSGQWTNELVISLSIEKPSGRRARRPFVAVWIEDADGRPVRTLSVWGNETKYLRELTSWWSFARGNQSLIRTVTKASRAPGQYELVWDGKDDKGVVVEPGVYTVRVESAREKGRHVDMKGKIACKDKAETAKIEGNSEIGQVTLQYGPREKKP